MKDRQNTLLWIKDLIEHMTVCHEQLQWAGQGPAVSFLTESLLVDLAECRRLCERLRAEQWGPEEVGSSARAASAARAKG